MKLLIPYEDNNSLIKGHYQTNKRIITISQGSTIT